MTESNTLLGGRYVIDGLVDAGGRGEIYIAHRTGPHDFERKVAVKRIREGLSEDEVAVERFLREANLAAQLHHPNIVEIVELGNESGEYYIVMELLRGKSLRVILERLAQQGRRCPPGIVARVVKGVAEALDFAHNFVVDGEPRPIVHRDVNIENVMVTWDDQVKLLDFGLARDLGAIDAVTLAGEMLGQPVYLAPECIVGSSTAPPRDVYALGVVSFMALSGSSPFPVEPGPAGIAQLLNTITDGPTPRLGGDVPEPLVELTAAAMAKDPATRLSARQVADRFGEWLGSDPQAAATRVSGLLEELFAGEEAAAALPVLDGGLGARPSAAPLSASVMAVGEDDVMVIEDEDEEDGSPAPVTKSGGAPLPEWASEAVEEPKEIIKSGAKPLPTVGERTGFDFRHLFLKWRRRLLPLLRWGTVIAAVVVCVVYWDIIGPTIAPYWEKARSFATDAGSAAGDKIDDIKELTEPPPLPPSQLPVVEEKPPEPEPESAAPPGPEGTLEIRCGWGWVQIDERTAGNCPHVSKKLPVGMHTVQLERGTGVITRRVKIIKNRTTTLDLRPKRRTRSESVEIGLEAGPEPGAEE